MNCVCFSLSIQMIDDSDWENFKASHAKSYSNKAEETKRFNFFFILNLF